VVRTLSKASQAAASISGNAQSQIRRTRNLFSDMLAPKCYPQFGRIVSSDSGADFPLAGRWDQGRSAACQRASFSAKLMPALAGLVEGSTFAS